MKRLRVAAPPEPSGGACDCKDKFHRDRQKNEEFKELDKFDCK